ncbi:hypothetical protein FGO68_gene1953 [Halteria grandinella]|uniref:Uncharacterized protein n=1 Tax=Halteria grandinella TaxID=5974 RepID=A0A8J8P3R3_HALGN|nr:hypothetical protein FGO68_gene1953 [Halteria grandinella]
MIIYFTTILLAFRLTHQVCTVAQAPFPKIFGSIIDATYINQIDYSGSYLAVAGCSKDKGFRGDTSTNTLFIPVVLVYQGPESTYLWGKSFTAMTGDPFYGVKINSAGTKVVDITNGNLVSVTWVVAATQYDNNYRNLLLLDSGLLYMGDGTQIFKIDPTLVTAAKYSLPSYQTVGLQYNTEQTHIHIFSYAANLCMLTVVDISTFTLVFQRQVQCQSATQSALQTKFQTCTHKEAASDDTIAFQEGTRFYRMRSEYLTPAFTGTTLHDPANPTTLQPMALHCGSSDLLYSLFWATAYQTDYNRVFVGKVDFNSGKMFYTRFLQQILDARPAVIIDANVFYLPSATQTIYKSPSQTFPLGSKTQSIIYSPLSTCQQVDEYEYPPVTLTMDSLVYTATALSYTLNSGSATNYISSIGAITNIDSTKFEGLFSVNCGKEVPLAIPEYNSVSSAQGTNLLEYTLGQSIATFSISPFMAGKVLPGNANPVFQYTLKSFNDALFPMSVNPTNGGITINPTTSLSIGKYTIVVQGLLQDCQTISASFTLQRASNVAPHFFQTLGNTLEQIISPKGESVSAIFPAIIDPDVTQVITVSMRPQPSFVEFTQTDIMVFPGLSTQIGTYPVFVDLFDGIATTTYSLTIHVVKESPYTITNQGPPIFMTEIKTIRLKMEEKATFFLPSIFDPDEDEIVTVSVELGDSLTFANFYNESHALSFNTIRDIVVKPKYMIEVNLIDSNQKPQQISKQCA